MRHAELLTLKEFADKARIYPQSAARIVASGGIPSTERDGRKFVRRADVVAFLAERAASKLPQAALVAIHALARGAGVDPAALLADSLDPTERASVEKAAGLLRRRIEAGR